MVLVIAAASLIVQYYKVNKSTITGTACALAAIDGAVTCYHMIASIISMFKNKYTFKKDDYTLPEALWLSCRILSVLYSISVVGFFITNTFVTKGLYNMSIAAIVLDSTSIIAVLLLSFQHIKRRPSNK